VGNPPPHKGVYQLWKTIPLKLCFGASGNQTVSGGGGGQDQNQTISDFIWGYNNRNSYRALNLSVMFSIIQFCGDLVLWL
jgi:predicted CDP-diglyceride synthetase/phosphatidate cytidylyltransferase